MANQSASSPFFARSYGGFTKHQLEFIHSVLPLGSLGAIFDPMAGQARDLGRFALEGHRVIAEDINPACLCFAALRSPEFVMHADELLRAYISDLSRVRIKAISETDFACDDWLTQSCKDFIRAYGKAFGIDEGCSAFEKGQSFWNGPKDKVFATAILVLAARQFVCHRSSKNTTWVKRGGVIPGISMKFLLKDFAILWKQHVIETLKPLASNSSGQLEIHTAPTDGTLSVANTMPISCVITSPPYANRLDYSVMWGPELVVMCELFNQDSQRIKRTQIGTTVVRGLKDEHEDDSLPDSAMRFLHEVTISKGKASDSYYLPFFRNYLVSLTRKLVSAARLVQKNGHFVVFIRDCVRKDARLDVERLVFEILKPEGFNYVAPDGAKKIIIKNHVGLRRPLEKGSVHGMAQIEWHLHLQRTGV